jgi:hypothetical protein
MVVDEVPTTPVQLLTFLPMVLLPARLVVETTPQLHLRVEPLRPARPVKVMLVDVATTKAHGLRVVVVVPDLPVAMPLLLQPVLVVPVPQLAGLPLPPKPRYL